MMTERMPARVLVFVSLLVMLMILPSTILRQVEARGPDLRLRPNDGPAGTTVLARGRDFPPGATGTIAWGDLSVSFGEFTADDDGEFEVAITVPDLPPGEYEVAAISAEAETVPTDTFTIEAADKHNRRPPPRPSGYGSGPWIRHGPDVAGATRRGRSQVVPC